MAEALAIIGLASNIISFIDFGLKVASGVQSMRSSQYGMTAEVEQLNLIVSRVEASNNQVLQIKYSSTKLSDSELHILGMVTECRSVASELRSAIKKLKVQDGPFKIMKVYYSAALNLMRKKDLETLRDRLETLDERIRTHIRDTLQKNHNSAITADLKQIKDIQDEMKIKHDAKLDLICEEAIRLASAARAPDATSQAAQMISLKMKLDLLEKQQSQCTAHIRLLKSLHVSDLMTRWSQIEKAHEKSNQWIFDREVTSFQAWLEGGETGDGLFCITGKPGSGKSTLMKYISDDQQTVDALKKWAGPIQLCTASFFFWNQGSKMQKSQLGLFQCLLYQIIRSVPELTSIIRRDHLMHEAWEINELKAIIDKIARHEVKTVKICFFVDGLDEYEGTEEELAEVLQFLHRSDYIKVCVSTRPRVTYDRLFCNQKRVFDVAKFTKEDIKQYIRAMLHIEQNFQPLEEKDPMVDRMIERIAEKADGVWLWVFLVTRDLRKALTSHESKEVLQAIIKDFPSDLNKYFSRMLKNIKPVYREETCRIFLIAINTRSPLPLYAYSLLEKEKEDPDYALKFLKVPIEEIKDYSLSEDYLTWKDRLRNRCDDLLVVDQGSGLQSFSLGYKVDFLHKTVREFLEENSSQLLQQLANARFNPAISLCRMNLVLLRSVPVIRNQQRRLNHDLIGRHSFPEPLIQLLYHAYMIEEEQDAACKTHLDGVLQQAAEIDLQWNPYVPTPQTLTHHSRLRADTYRLKYRREYYDFLDIAVQIGLVHYVRNHLERLANGTGPPQKGELKSSSGRLSNLIRSHVLEYALHPCFRWRVLPGDDVLSINTDMIRLLLEYGADPNVPTRLFNEYQTVFEMLLLKCHEDVQRYQESKKLISSSNIESWFLVCQLLVDYGARISHPSTCFDNMAHQPLCQTIDVDKILFDIFGSKRSAELKSLMEAKEKEREEEREVKRPVAWSFALSYVPSYLVRLVSRGE